MLLLPEIMIIFVSSPYAGNIEENTTAARRYCRYVVEQGHTPIAPHLFFPQFLDEDRERLLGLQMGLQLLDFCDEIWVFGVPSSGMRSEIAYAEENSIPVRYKNAL